MVVRTTFATARLLRSLLPVSETPSLPPLPGRHELALPHATPRRPCPGLLCHVGKRVLPVSQGPSLGDHPGTEVPPPGSARRHDPSVTVAVPLFAFNGLVADQAGERSVSHTGRTAKDALRTGISARFQARQCRASERAPCPCRGCLRQSPGPVPEASSQSRGRF